MKNARLAAALLVAAALAVPAFVALPAPAAAQGADADALRAVLLESKEKSRGVAIHANGTTINAVVVSVDERYVIARSQQSSRIVVRLDRIDGVSAFF
jgi:uncharacterized membrane protein